MDKNFIHRKTQVVIHQFPLMVMGIDGGPASSPVRRLICTIGTRAGPVLSPPGQDRGLPAQVDGQG